MTDRRCEFWTGRRCRLGLHGGRPSPGTCAVCQVRVGGELPAEPEPKPRAKRGGGCRGRRRPCWLRWGVVPLAAFARDLADWSRDERPSWVGERGRRN